MNWQPIESAPKDGTAMLAVGDSYGKPARGRHFAVVAWSQSGCAMFEVGDACEADPFQYLTHWMPLPSPPEAP